MKLTSSTDQNSLHSNPPAGSRSISNNQRELDERRKLIVKTALGTFGAVAAAATIYRFTHLSQVDNKIFPADFPSLPQLIVAFGTLGFGLCVRAYNRTESHAAPQRKPLEQKDAKQQNDDRFPVTDNPTTSTQTNVDYQRKPVNDTAEKEKTNNQHPIVVKEEDLKITPIQIQSNVSDQSGQMTDTAKKEEFEVHVNSFQPVVNDHATKSEIIQNEKLEPSKLKQQPIASVNKGIEFLEEGEIILILSSRNVSLDSSNNSSEAVEEANSRIISLRQKYNNTASIGEYLKKFPLVRLKNLKKYYSRTLRINEILSGNINFDLKEVIATVNGVNDATNKAAKLKYVAYEWAAISYLLKCNIIDFVDTVVNLKEKTTQNNKLTKNETLSITGS